MKKLFLILALCSVTNSAVAADLFTDKERQKMMQLTLENFWGKAIDSKGEPVVPKDEKERTTIPISKEQATHIINKGGESGLAQWCGLPWEERYQLIIEQQRKFMNSDTQIAYAGVLHGLAQQMIVSSMKKEICDSETKEQISAILSEDIKNLKQSLVAK